MNLIPDFSPPVGGFQRHIIFSGHLHNDSFSGEILNKVFRLN